MRYTVGATPGVEVSKLKPAGTGSFNLVVTTDNAKQGVALATLLLPNRTFSPKISPIVVRVSVENSKHEVYAAATPTTSKQVAGLVQAAFAANPLYQEAVVAPWGTRLHQVAVFPVFKPSVVQFGNGNIGDLYNNFNGVAASVFRDVMEKEVADFFVFPSTAKVS
jgi:hypothetical protein